MNVFYKITKKSSNVVNFPLKKTKSNEIRNNGESIKDLQ